MFWIASLGVVATIAFLITEHVIVQLDGSSASPSSNLFSISELRHGYQAALASNEHHRLHCFRHDNCPDGFVHLVGRLQAAGSAATYPEGPPQPTIAAI